MMNHGKRLLSLLLALVLLLGMAQGVAFAAGTTVTLVPSTTQALKPGDSFTVTAKISGNTGYHSVVFPITFDKNVFTCTGFVKRGYAFGYGSSSDNTEKSYGAYINLALADADETNDDMFLMKFTVKDNAAAGSYSIAINNSDSDFNFSKQEGGYGSTNFVPLNASFVPASVTITASQPTEPTIVPVSSIALNPSNLSLTVGGTATLTATVSPANATDKTVAWSSSNSSVASVNNGTVTANAAGSAIITATAGNYSATATVNVSEPAAPVAGDHADISSSSESVKPGEYAAFEIFVDNHDIASSYNSYEFELSYDASKLSYVDVSDGNNDEKCDGTVKTPGKLVINGYGDAKSSSATKALATVVFKVSETAEVGATSVKITKAYRGTSASAVNYDIDSIDIGTSTAAISIEAEKPTYTVTFSEPVTINGETGKTSATVISGESVTFTVLEKTGHDFSVTGAMKNNDGSYTVSNVTSDTTVTISYTAKSYSVTVTDTGKDDVTAPATATYGAAYSFRVNKDSAYNYTVSVTVGDKTVSASESNGTYTIAAADVTGNIAISVAKEKKSTQPTEYTVTIYKNGVADAATGKATSGQSYTKAADEGYVIYKVKMNGSEISDFTKTNVNISSVTGNIEIYMGQSYSVTLPTDGSVTGASSASYGSDYSFTVKDGCTATVTIGGTAFTPSQSENGFVISGTQITGNIEITTQKISYADSVVVYDYVKSQNATLIQLVVAKPSESLASGEILQYDGNNMLHSAKYQGYAYLVAVGANEAKLTSEAATAKISKATATATEINYGGDVNMSRKIDINDAQLVYDIYKALYSDFSTVSMEKMLRADVTGNCVITVEDVANVVSTVRSK